MVTCPACGLPVAAEDRFCSRCGHELAATDGQTRRRLVTVLFCDQVGSTELGERLDAELLRDIQARYFATCADALIRHGGQVEKFIGDAVMCVFGLPRAHEDDALRACRAAVELAAAVRVLSEELEGAHGIGLRVRIGVQSGEVVTGDVAGGQALATGDAVNTAARLEQAAGPDEVLIGAMTRRLAGTAVRAEPVVPVTARGKSAPVTAHRLVGLQEGEPSSGSTFAGRAAELAVLRATVAAARGGDGRAMTVLGEAGIGKSRIVAELLARDCAGARVLRGRCLSYGEGIAFWPLREALDRLSAVEDRPLAALLEHDADPAELADRLNRLVGRTHGTISAADGAVAVRRMLAALAADGPLVVVVEDVHWAEAALLDLLEDVVADPVAASCLILTARPDFRDRRPGLALTAITLGPLEREHAAALVDGVPAGRRAAVLDAADGNPLFLEQLAAGIEPKGRLPASLRALLSARVDALPDSRRSVLDAAAVCGRDFFRAPLARLVPDQARELTAHLAVLTVGGLIERGHRDGAPATGMTALFGSERYAFVHALVRDAVLEALPKGRAAELHEAFAGLLEAEPDAPVPIVAWHLDRAAALRLELEPLRAVHVAQRAADALEAAGQEALARDDALAARGLRSRAAELLEAASAATDPASSQHARPSRASSAARAIRRWATRSP